MCSLGPQVNILPPKPRCPRLLLAMLIDPYTAYFGSVWLGSQAKPALPTPPLRLY